MNISEPRSTLESLWGTQGSPNLLSLDRAAARHAADTEDREHRQGREEGHAARLAESQESARNDRQRRAYLRGTPAKSACE